MDSFKLIKRPSKSLLTSRSSKSRETLQTIHTPLDVLPPGPQKHEPPTRRTTTRYPQSEHEFPEADKNHTSRISNTQKFELLLSSSRIPSTFKVAIEKATMTTNGNQTDKSFQTKGKSRA